MNIPRYDYQVYYWTPKSNPLCHFYYEKFREVSEMEGLWKKHRIDAYVVRVVDTQTGEVLYERAQA